MDFILHLSLFVLILVPTIVVGDNIKLYSFEEDKINYNHKIKTKLSNIIKVSCPQGKIEILGKCRPLLS